MHVLWGMSLWGGKGGGGRSAEDGGAAREARADRRCCFFFSSRRRHTRLQGDWSSDVCSSDLSTEAIPRSWYQGTCEGVVSICSTPTTGMFVASSPATSPSSTSRISPAWSPSGADRKSVV